MLPQRLLMPTFCAAQASSLEQASCQESPKNIQRGSVVLRLAKTGLRRASTFSRPSVPELTLSTGTEAQSALASRCASRCFVESIGFEEGESSVNSNPLLSRRSSTLNAPHSTSTTAYMPAFQNFYTPEMLQRRARLRWNSKIRRHALKFWRVADVQRAVITMDEYLDFHLSVYHWLLNGSSFDEEDAFRSGLEDWQRDAETGTLLSCEKFMTSLYELADIYVESVEPDTYVQFLQELFVNVTSPSSKETRRFRAGKTTKRSWRHRWAPARKTELMELTFTARSEDSTSTVLSQIPSGTRRGTTWEMLRGTVRLL